MHARHATASLVFFTATIDYRLLSFPANILDSGTRIESFFSNIFVSQFSSRVYTIFVEITGCWSSPSQHRPPLFPPLTTTPLPVLRTTAMKMTMMLLMTMLPKILLASAISLRPEIPSPPRDRRPTQTCSFFPIGAGGRSRCRPPGSRPLIKNKYERYRN